jgi:radical SAM superfamily enzyme YgiQ (UPF0313 family)
MLLPKLALARVNYSQLYDVYDGGKTYKYRDILVPYQLLNLAGYIRTCGVEVEIFDGEVTLMNQAQLAGTIVDWKPQFVGLTATTPDIGLSLEVCRLVKDHNASIVTIMGGPHVSALPEEVAQNSYVDYVVVGDGEKPLQEIIEREKSRVLAGVKVADSHNPPATEKIIRGFMPDLSTYPMPAHDLLDYSNYLFTDPSRGQYKTASVMSSWGCPYNCTFCFHNKRLRYRKIDDFISEIEYLYREKGVRYFFVYDDTFLVKNSRVLEIAKRIKSSGMKDARFQCQSRADLVTPDVIKALRQANFVRVSMGVESGSTTMLEMIKKGVTKEDYIEACRILYDHGIEPRASFIVGLPYETRQTIMETINFAKELNFLAANFTIMTPYPGTQMYEMALKGEGLHFSRPEYARQWSIYRRWGKAFVETDELSANDLEHLREKAVIEFYSQPKVFEYYRSLFEEGNRTRYFYRPLNFAWQKKFGKCVPFWNELDRTEVVAPD